MKRKKRTDIIYYPDWMNMDREADIKVALEYLDEVKYKAKNTSQLQLARNLAWNTKYVVSVEQYDYMGSYDSNGVLTRQGIEYAFAPFGVEHFDTDIYDGYEND